ncbi:MAG: hypothetical protein LBR10_14460 [Prevotellaceae bacterium]|jgi:hypothetical protein|nr:hypothetical protein [Prevotellaceae bacterium]
MTEKLFFDVINEMPNMIESHHNGVLEKQISLYRGCINNDINANYHIRNYKENKQLNLYLNKITGSVSVNLWDGNEKSEWDKLRQVERVDTISKEFIYQLIKKYL